MEFREKSVGKKWEFGRKCGEKKKKEKDGKVGKRWKEKSEFWGKKKATEKNGKNPGKWWNLGKKPKCWKREGEKWEKRGKNEEKKSGM